MRDLTWRAEEFAMMLRFLDFLRETRHTQRVRFGWFPQGYWTLSRAAGIVTRYLTFDPGAEPTATIKRSRKEEHSWKSSALARSNRIEAPQTGSPAPFASTRYFKQRNQRA
jgi:hypothetical protein